jgi:beta-lactamase class A
MRYWLFLTLLIYFPAEAQKTDNSLQKKIESLIRTHHGKVAVYVKNLKTGRTAAVNADSVYPTASLVKVPILIGIMDKLNRNELQFHQELMYHDSLLYPGVDILGSFKQGEKIHLSKLMMLMTTMSDNTASIWLQLLAGTGTRINEIMDSLGFRYTRVNSRTQGRETERARYGWGQCTAREMATLFERIYRRDIITAAVSDRMLRSLNRNYWDGEAVSHIPPYATIFSKNGALDEYRSEAVLVRGIKSEYVFCVITSQNQDTSWKEDNEAWQLIRQLSSMLWNHFEPSRPWTPPPGADRYY